jgi:putative FmdB family regulatory protein
MPIYEYRCPDCGHQFEEWQKMSEPPVTQCPECSKDNVSKLLSAPAFHLKGSGWYSDHYGLKSGDGASDSPSSGSPSPAAKASEPASASSSESGASSPAPSAPSPSPSSSDD